MRSTDGKSLPMLHLDGAGGGHRRSESPHGRSSKVLTARSQQIAIAQRLQKRTSSRATDSATRRGSGDDNEDAIPPREKGQIQARNFGVQLVQKLDVGLRNLAPRFAEHPWGMPCYAFVEAIKNLLAEREAQREAEAESARSAALWRNRRHLTDSVGAESLAPRLVSPTSDALKFDLSSPSKEAPKSPVSVALLDAEAPDVPPPVGVQGRHRPPVPPHVRNHIQRFEQTMAVQMDRWLQQNGAAALAEADLFADGVLLAFGLWELFRGIDHKNTGLITWSAFTAYLIDSTMKGKVTSLSDGVRQYTLVMERLSPALYRMERICHVPNLKGYLALTRGKPAVRDGSTEGKQSLRLIDSATCQLRRTLALHEGGGHVLAFTYVDHYNGLLVLSYSDGRVRICSLPSADTPSFEVRMVGPALSGKYECAIARMAQQRARDMPHMSSVAATALHTCGPHCPFVVDEAQEDGDSEQAQTARRRKRGAREPPTPTGTHASAAPQPFSPQTMLVWSQKTLRLFVGSKQGFLSQWDLSPVERLLMPGSAPHEPGVDWTFKVHSDAVTDLSLLSEDQVVASSSLDGTVTLINLEMRQILRRLVPTNPLGGLRGLADAAGGDAYPGITSLAFCKRTNHLVSAGMEFEPLCWVVNVPNSRPIALRDGRSPHKYSIAALVAVPHTTQIVSMDVKGVIKVWDLSVMRCAQTLLCEGGVGRAELKSLFWHDLAYNASQKQLVTSGKRKVYVFEYGIRERNLDPNSAADYSIASAIYTPFTQTFITAARRNVRIWNGVDGEQLRYFEGIVKDDVTAMCIDAEAHRFYVGTHGGEVLAFLYETATLVKCWQHPSDREIVSVQYADGHAYLAVVAADGSLMAVEEDVKTERLIGRPIQRDRDRKIDAKVCLLDPHNRVLLVGQGHNTVTAFDTSRNPRNNIYNKRCECANTPANTEVTALVSIAPICGFVSADAAGGLHCWQIPPEQPAAGQTTAPKVLAQWVNHHPSTSKREYTPTITVMAWLPQYYLLYSGDDSGVVNVYTLRGCLEGNRLTGTTLADVLGGRGVQSPMHKLLSVCQGLRGRTRTIRDEATHRTLIAEKEKEKQKRDKDRRVTPPPSSRRSSVSSASRSPPRGTRTELITPHVESIPVRISIPEPEGKDGTFMTAVSPNGSTPKQPAPRSKPRMSLSLRQAVDKAAQKPKLITHWYAHQFSVTVVQILGVDPDAPATALTVLTGGTDCNVVLWTLFGRRITCLAKDRADGFQWGLRLHKDVEKEEEAPDVEWSPHLYNDIPQPWNPLGQRMEDAREQMVQDIEVAASAEQRRSKSFLSQLRRAQEAESEAAAAAQAAPPTITDAAKRAQEKKDEELRCARKQWRQELGADFEQLQAKLRALGNFSGDAGESASIAALREQLLQASEPYNYRLLLQRCNPRAAQQQELKMLYAAARGAAVAPDTMQSGPVTPRTPPFRLQRQHLDLRFARSQSPPAPLTPHRTFADLSSCESQRGRPTGCPDWLSAKKLHRAVTGQLRYYDAEHWEASQYTVGMPVVVQQRVGCEGGHVVEAGEVGKVVTLAAAMRSTYPRAKQGRDQAKRPPAESCAEVQVGRVRFWATTGDITPADPYGATIYGSSQGWKSYLLHAGAGSRLPDTGGTPAGRSVSPAPPRAAARSCPPLVGRDCPNERTAGRTKPVAAARVHKLPPVHYRKVWQKLSGAVTPDPDADLHFVSQKGVLDHPADCSVLAGGTVSAAPGGGSLASVSQVLPPAMTDRRSPSR